LADARTNSLGIDGRNPEGHYIGFWGAIINADGWSVDDLCHAQVTGIIMANTFVALPRQVKIF
jgi:hypothetical protein